MTTLIDLTILTLVRLQYLCILDTLRRDSRSDQSKNQSQCSQANKQNIHFVGSSFGKYSKPNLNEIVKRNHVNGNKEVFEIKESEEVKMKEYGTSEKQTLNSGNKLKKYFHSIKT